MNTQEFFFMTDIPADRKQEIVDWVNALPPDNRKMVRELRSDAAEEAHYFATETEDC